MHKPSLLWPPPDKAESTEIRQRIRHRIRRVTEFGDQDRFKSFLRSRGRASRQRNESATTDQVTNGSGQLHLGTSTSALSVVDEQDQRIVMKTEGGDTLTVDSQIQLYAPNNLLPHPLICHCRAYLGGLPPLFFTAGDQEVLRDEIIYTCVFSLH